MRTVGQLFAHIADGQYEFCSVATEGKPVSKDIEKTAKTKAEIVAALKEAFAYCDAAYADLTDAKAPELVTFFGTRLTRLGVMDFNITHNMEHYGNLVTYMRLKGIVPLQALPAPRLPPLSNKASRSEIRWRRATGGFASLIRNGNTNRCGTSSAFP